MQDSVVDDEVTMYHDIQLGEYNFLVAYCVFDVSFCRDILSEALLISSFHPLFRLSPLLPIAFIFKKFHDSKYRHARHTRHSYSLSSIYNSHLENSGQMVLFKIWRENVHEFASF